MTHKLKQHLSRAALIQSNRLPNKRARKYITNSLRTIRQKSPSAPLRASLGFIRWVNSLLFHSEVRVSYRASCFLTGRSRGISRRLSVARTRLKELASMNLLLGLRKSSF